MTTSPRPLAIALVLVGMTVGACTPATTTAPATTTPPTPVAPSSVATAPTVPTPVTYPPAPAVPTGPLADGLSQDLDSLVQSLIAAAVDPEAMDRVVAAGDARVGWLLSDLMRFAGAGDVAVVAEGFRSLTGADVLGSDISTTWLDLTNHLIAWDLPAPPGYRADKEALFVALEPGWAPFFADADADIDWRLVSWGGVRIDDRPAGATQPCPQGCIPALDDPLLVPADEGSWYPDDGLVFGVVVDGEAVALPRNQMQVHEMVNLTLGGRRLGIPYCTLCNSAQAWVTDDLPDGFDTAVLRTTGLLSRSNKVMYDLTSLSVIDTFTGEARSGPLHDAGVVLEQVTVVGSTWAAWRADHPDTGIIAEDGGLGRSYPLDPLRGRDDDGPIFPIGPVDPRLDVQEDVVGAIAADGTAVAFPTEATRATLEAGMEVEQAGLHPRLDGDGLRIVDDAGEEVVAHQSFWFAWSQFHPDTQVWVDTG